MKTEKPEILFLLWRIWFCLRSLGPNWENSFCLGLPRLCSFRKVEPVQGKPQGTLGLGVCTGREAPGPLHPTPSFLFPMHWPFVLLSVGIVCSWASTFLNPPPPPPLWTKDYVPLGRSKLGHQFWKGHGDFISRINKKR